MKETGGQFSFRDNSPEACMHRFNERQKLKPKKPSNTVDNNTYFHTLYEIAEETGFGWLRQTDEQKEVLNSLTSKEDNHPKNT
jgi:hypothetical protein